MIQFLLTIILFMISNFSFSQEVLSLKEIAAKTTLMYKNQGEIFIQSLDLLPEDLKEYLKKFDHHIIKKILSAIASNEYTIAKKVSNQYTTSIKYPGWIFNSFKSMNWELPPNAKTIEYRSIQYHQSRELLAIAGHCHHKMMIDKLLDLGYKVDNPSIDLRPSFHPLLPLFQAIRGGDDVEFIEYLIARGAILKFEKNPRDSTPLTLAIENHRNNIVEFFLKKGLLLADLEPSYGPNAYTYNNAKDLERGIEEVSIIKAIDYKNLTAFDLLLTYGAKINYKTIKYLIRKGNNETLNCLLEKYTFNSDMLIKLKKWALKRYDYNISSPMLTSYKRFEYDWNGYENAQKNLILISEKLKIESNLNILCDGTFMNKKLHKKNNINPMLTADNSVITNQFSKRIIDK